MTGVLMPWKIAREESRNFQKLSRDILFPAGRQKTARLGNAPYKRGAGRTGLECRDCSPNNPPRNPQNTAGGGKGLNVFNIVGRVP